MLTQESMSQLSFDKPTIHTHTHTHKPFSYYHIQLIDRNTSTYNFDYSKPYRSSFFLRSTPEKTVEVIRIATSIRLNPAIL